MKNYTIFFCLSLFFIPVFSLFGQKKWTFKDNEHSFIVNTDTILYGGETGEYAQTITSIHVYSLNDKKTIQIIYPEQFLFETYLDSTYVFAIEDINFDGLNDIRLLSWLSANLQNTYWYWIYDSKTGQFQFQTDTILNELRNPFFNSTTKMIHTWWRDSFYAYGHALYEWNEKKLQLVASEEELWSIIPDMPGELIIMQRKNGEINVKKIEIKEEQFNYLHDQEKCPLHEK